MKTHNALIYHCLNCGKVVHAEPSAPVPACCGHLMTRAAMETICEADEPEAGDAESRTARPLKQAKAKPR